MPEMLIKQFLSGRQLLSGLLPLRRLLSLMHLLQALPQMSLQLVLHRLHLLHLPHLQISNGRLLHMRIQTTLYKLHRNLLRG